MTVLVTGGAGFIGSHLVDALLAAGRRVTVLDNLATGRLANLGGQRDGSRLRFIQGSTLDRAALAPLVAAAELIFHLAAVVGVKYIVDDPLGSIITNVRGTENVLELAAARGVRTVIASSSEVYGKNAAVPLHEESDRLLGPTSIGRWAYSEAKAIDEYLALGYAERGLPVSIVRYFNSYGPRLDPRGYGSVIARFIGQALRGEPLTIYDDGLQTRTFTYVSDTVSGTLAAAAVDGALGQAFNIGSAGETSIRALAERVIALAGSRSTIEHVPYAAAFSAPFEETRRRVPDVTRARAVLRFEAQVGLEEGLQRTLAWFRSQ